DEPHAAPARRAQPSRRRGAEYHAEPPRPFLVGGVPEAQGPHHSLSAGIGHRSTRPRRRRGSQFEAGGQGAATLVQPGRQPARGRRTRQRGVGGGPLWQAERTSLSARERASARASQSGDRRGGG